MHVIRYETFSCGLRRPIFGILTFPLVRDDALASRGHVLRSGSSFFYYYFSFFVVYDVHGVSPSSFVTVQFTAPLLYAYWSVVPISLGHGFLAFFFQLLPRVKRGEVLPHLPTILRLPGVIYLYGICCLVQHVPMLLATLCHSTEVITVPRLATTPFTYGSHSVSV